MTTPPPPDLKAWLKRWTAIKKSAYAELVASYTDEQREIVRRMNHAGRQAELCKRRIISPTGYSDARTVAWPEEPSE